MRCAGLIYDDSPHYLDHLGPFCAHLGWPLIVCEEALAELATRYYPDLKVIYTPVLQLELPPFTVTCDNQPLLRAAFPGQTTQTLWLPHGNSDKGWNSPLFKTLQEESVLLVYGQKMIDFFQVKSASLIRIGNFRWRYWLKHQKFYQTLIQDLLPPSNYLLYAPTWDDSNSFWKAFPPLARAVPEEVHLLVKLHPNTVKRFPAEVEILKGKLSRENITFLPEFPPIYPLLSRCEAYIGDMSSIGYDFLTFDKPLFFLNANRQLYLSQCGTPIDPETFDFRWKDSLTSRRKAAYEYTFQEEPQWEDKLHALCGI